MLRRVLSLLALLIVPPASAATFTSTQTGNWSSASTWGGAGVPGPADTVTINTSHFITLDVPVTIHTLNLNSGTLTGDQALDITSAFNWTGGTHAGSAITTITPGATLTVAANCLLNARTIGNDGTIDFLGGSTLQFQNPGAPGATNIANRNIIRKIGAATTATLTIPLSMASGSQFNVETGTFNIGPFSSTGGVFNVASGSTLDMGSTVTRSIDAASAITGAGTVRFGNGTNNLSGTYNVTGFTIANGSHTTTIGNAVSMGALTLTSGVLTLNGAGPVAINGLTLSNGTLDGAAPLNLVGTSTWASGIIRGSGLMTIADTATVSVVNPVSGPVTLDARPVQNSGLINIDISTNQQFVLQANAQLTNNASGTIHIRNSVRIDVQGVAGTTAIINNGTIRKSTSPTTGTISVPLTLNGGQIAVDAGTLVIGTTTANGGTVNVEAAGILHLLTPVTRNFNAGSTFMGTGLIRWTQGTNTVNGAYNFTGTTESNGAATTTLWNVSAIGPVALSSGTLAINGPDVSIPTLAITNGMFTGAANVTLTGTMNWSGGSIQGGGALTIGPASAVNITGNFSALVRPITNNGALNINGGTFTLQNSAAITNFGTIDFKTDLSIPGVGAGTMRITNHGTIKKSAGGLNSTIDLPLFAMAGSLVVAEAGTIQLDDVTSTGATFRANAGAQLNFFRLVTRTFDAASTIEGAGTIRWDAGTNNVDGNYNVTGSTINQSTTTLSNITSTGTLTNQGGVLSLNAVSPVSIATLNQSAGTLQGTAPIVITGSSTWSGGTIRGTAPFTIATTGNVNVINDLILETRTLTNEGMLRFTVDGSSITLTVSAGVVNQSTGTVDFVADGQFLSGTGSIFFTNNGLVRKSGGPVNSSLDAPMTANPGSQVLVTAGTLQLDAITATGAAFNASAGATLSFFFVGNRSFDAASTISGAGTIRFNSGTSVVDGTYNVTGATVNNATPTTLNNITSLGALTNSAGTLTLNKGGEVGIPSLTMVAGTLTGTAALNVTGGAASSWQGGTITGAEALTIGPGAAINISGGTLSAKTLNNQGAINIGNSALWMLSNNAQIANSGILTMGSAGQINPSGSVGTIALTSSGTIRKIVAGAAGTIAVPLVLQSGSQIVMDASDLSLGMVTATGTNVTIASGATLTFSTNNPRTFDSTSTFSGAGAIRTQGGTTTISGTVSCGLNANGGTLIINNGSPQSVQSLAMAGGILDGTAPLTVVGTTPMTWSHGLINGSGMLTIASGAAVNIVGSPTINGRPMTNIGTMNFLTGGALLVSGTTVVTNSGLLDFRNDASAVSRTGGTPSLVNTGTIRKSLGDSVSSLALPVTNMGLIEAASGILEIYDNTANGGTYAAMTGATVDLLFATTVASTGTISGTGLIRARGMTNVVSGATLTIESTLTNMQTGAVNISGGTITGAGLLVNGGTVVSTGTSALTSGVDNNATIEIPNGVLTVNGSTFGNDGTIYFPIASTTVFGAMNATGTFTRSGTLKARPLTGFTPPYDSSYPVFTFGSVTGAFATNDVMFTGGWLVPFYTPTTGTLVAMEKKPTATFITVSENPALVGTPVTFTAAVTDVANLGGTPTGAVNVVSDSGESCTANCAITFGAVGLKTITATYSGDSGFAVSSAGTTVQIKANTTTTIPMLSTSTPVVGQPVTINIQVTVVPPGAGNPTGSVTVTDGTASCIAPADSGSCQLTWTTPGVRTLNASYAGDANYNASATASASEVTVGKGNTSVAITGQSASATFPGETFTVSFAVSAVSPAVGTPTGTVTVTDGVDSCSGVASCELALSTAGTRTLTATYNGDSNFNASPASPGLMHTVNPCTYELTYSSINAPAEGMSGMFGIVTPCGWTAVSNAAFITTSSAGMGNGNISFTVAPNAKTVARSGTITVGGLTFTVNQSAVTVSSLNATAAAASVTLTWSSAATDHFEIWRNEVLLTTSPVASYTDNTVTTNTAYKYKVRAVDSDGAMSAFSNSDLAVLIAFRDDPLIAGVTPIKATHIYDLREAINAVRALAGLPPFTFTSAALEGQPIRMVDTSELRDAFEPARTLLGIPPVSYVTIGAGGPVPALALMQLRDAMR